MWDSNINANLMHSHPQYTENVGKGKDWSVTQANIKAIIIVQSDLGYPATSGPAHIRISDLAGYERYAWTQQVQ